MGSAGGGPGAPTGTQRPSALTRFDDIVKAGRGRRLLLFLDFDGTLTPIVDDPAAARLDPKVRQLVERLATLAEVAIVTGRELEDVRRRISVEPVYYAGSHGFDIAGPGGLRAEYGVEFLPHLDRIEHTLREQLAPVEGVLVERKRFSVAVHYRLTPAERKATVLETAEAAARREGLRCGHGKQVLELQPALDWHKGRAVALLSQVMAPVADRLPLYIGDDVTDEDAFRAVADDSGIGIHVGAADTPSAAAFQLADPAEVLVFLERFAQVLHPMAE